MCYELRFPCLLCQYDLAAASIATPGAVSFVILTGSSLNAQKQRPQHTHRKNIDSPASLQSPTETS